ncbi:STY0301 family protein [Janthinobacterium sp. GB4P2]|uniref:STY0301 family protein n=1 Tax=Janthinobacterium sp. GB4P2 TaxID=3424189 RepID=UPI003F1F2CC2
MADLTPAPDPGTQRLSMARRSAGGQLVPSGERKKKGKTTLSYRLEGSYPDGKWLQCRYGVHGEVTLSRRMDDSVSHCEFTYRKGRKAGQSEIDIDCR